MKVEINPCGLSGTVSAPPSKSYAHRLMIAAALTGGKHIVKNVGESKDVHATCGALRALGGNCRIDNGDFVVEDFVSVSSAVVDCKESGSTLRFLLPIAAALGINAKFIGAQSLLSRPCGELIKTLNDNGADISDFTVNGKLLSGDFEVNGEISSQYITGLLMAMPLLNGVCRLKIVGKTVSAPYIAITEDVLSRSGINKRAENGVYVFDGSEKYSLNDLTVSEGDFSGAAFMLSAGALGGPVTVRGLNPDTVQGDSAILSVLSAFGAKITTDFDKVIAEKGKLHGISLDCENIPDLVQIISVVAAFSQGKTTLYNIDRLRYKESDRIAAVINCLTAAGIKAETDGSTLVIYGGRPTGGVFDSVNDHRTAMSAAVLATYSDGTSTINGAEAVDKSYPSFFEDFVDLGGKINVVDER